MSPNIYVFPLYLRPDRLILRAATKRQHDPRTANTSTRLLEANYVAASKLESPRFGMVQGLLALFRDALRRCRASCRLWWRGAATDLLARGQCYRAGIHECGQSSRLAVLSSTNATSIGVATMGSCGHQRSADRQPSSSHQTSDSTSVPTVSMTRECFTSFNQRATTPCRCSHRRRKQELSSENRHSRAPCRNIVNLV